LVLYSEASHYQPLSVKFQAATGAPSNPSGIEHGALLTSISSTGLLGVSVLALHPEFRGNPPLDVGSPLPCFRRVGTELWCGQNKQGLLTGDKFHPFAISGNSAVPVAWQFTYICKAYAGDVWIGKVAVRVTSRFAWFTHTTLMVVNFPPTALAASCKPSG
jgi:hypothetical protein